MIICNELFLVNEATFEVKRPSFPFCYYLHPTYQLHPAYILHIFILPTLVLPTYIHPTYIHPSYILPTYLPTYKRPLAKGAKFANDIFVNEKYSKEYSK